MSDAGEGRHIDPEAFICMMPAQRRENTALRRRRILETGPAELLELRVESLNLFDATKDAIDVKLSLKRHIERLRRDGASEEVLSKKEAALLAVMGEIEDLTSKMRELQDLIEREARSLEFSKFPLEARDEAERLMKERDEAIRKMRPTPTERQAGFNVGAQLRLMTQIYSRPRESHDPAHLAEMERQLDELQHKMARIDRAINRRMTRIVKVRTHYETLLAGLREPS